MKTSNFEKNDFDQGDRFRAENDAHERREKSERIRFSQLDDATIERAWQQLKSEPGGHFLTDKDPRGYLARKLIIARLNTSSRYAVA